MGKTFSCSHCGAAIPLEGLRSGSLTKCPSCKKDSFVPLQFIPKGDKHLRCPKCTAKFEESESVCRNCKAKLPGPNTRRRVAEEMYFNWVAKWKKVLLVWGAGILLVAGWFLIPAPELQPEDEVCGSNLRFLYSMLEMAAKGPKGVPDSTGSRFWAELVSGEMGPTAPACPSALRNRLGGVIGYRGPAKPIRELAANAPIACDFADQHRAGIAVLLKNGTIYVAPPGSPEHAKALEGTKE